ncbi:hypothetical protein [Parageobacillus thermoglucosidasius]|uniref:hypothetical protein n=1 Tax=Parageobacillus thermoglucosidasius TaxID=1426 RepID=UPI0001D18C3A|nr:hypothetical protein [Parageobacillus thermoglucosidasius]AEH46694.1 hypothetical protein Geoth_0694 [Parageobacillus thermoglucosidasius C56-YS93]
MKAAFSQMDDYQKASCSVAIPVTRVWNPKNHSNYRPSVLATIIPTCVSGSMATATVGESSAKFIFYHIGLPSHSLVP